MSVNSIWQNLDLESSLLDSYFTNDFNVQYTVKSIPFIKTLILTGQVNNIFNTLYENNGFFFSFDVPNEAGDGVPLLMVQDFSLKQEQTS